MEQNKIINLIWLGMILIVTGCAQAPVKMSQNDMQTLKSAPKIIAIHNGPIGPAVSTAMGAVAFHFTMGMAQGEAGSAIMKRFNMQDPIVLVQNQFITDVMKQTKMRNLYVIKQPVPYGERDLEDLQKRYKTGYYLQFVPGMWNVIYYATSWSHYHMYYNAEARLVRLDDGKVFWASRCVANQENKDNPPTIEQLEANNGALLKTWTEKAARECAVQLTKDFLAQT